MKYLFLQCTNLLILSTVLLIQPVICDISFDQVKKYAITSEEFRDIKRSEAEYDLANAYSFLEGNGKTSYNIDNNQQFIQEVHETWDLAFQAEETLQSGKTMYSATDLGVTSAFFPFLVCVSSNDKKESGYQRMKSLSERFMDIDKQFISPSVDEWSDFGVHDKSTAGSNSPVYPMYNTADRSCFGVNSLASEAKETAAYSSADTSEDDFFVIPFTHSMKIEFGTIEEIERRFGGNNNNIFQGYSALETMKVRLAIQFSPGTADGTKNSADWNAEKIITVSRALANGYYGNRRKLSSNFRSVNKKENESNDFDESLDSILKIYTVSYKDIKDDDFSSRYLQDLAQMNGPCDDALQHISYESYSLGHSFDTEISFTNADETTKQCVLTFLRAMAQQPEVLSLAAIPVFEAFNDLASKILLQSGKADDDSSSNPFHELGFTGINQVVAVSDTGVDQENCYFYDETGPIPTNGYVDQSKRKVVQYFVGGGNGVDETGGHGTHVAGTVLGEKSTDGVNGEDSAGNGIAYEAKLAFCDIGSGGSGLNPASDMKFLLEPGRIAQANIHTASWGAGSNLGGYTYYCTRFDEYLYLNQEFLVTMAAGNSGSWGISWPATAKNIVAVGATANDLDDKLNLAPFSSRGSVDGNRIKPDVVAPGMSIFSAYGGTDCNVLRMQGTSMATPAVAGVSAIIRQYLIEKGIKPGASLVKSLLANSGQAINYGTVYDQNQGFGLVDLLQTLPLPGHNQFNLLCQNLESVSEGGTNTIELSIDTSSGSCDMPLSVTMVYTDPAGASILNNIDLEVQNNAGKIFYPNGLNEADNFNVIERVRVNDVTDGEKYIIRILGTNLIQSSILYSLSATGCFQVSSKQSSNTFLIEPSNGDAAVENVEPNDPAVVDNIEMQIPQAESTNTYNAANNVDTKTVSAKNMNNKKASEKQGKNGYSGQVEVVTEKKYYSDVTDNPVSPPGYKIAQSKTFKGNHHY